MAGRRNNVVVYVTIDPGQATGWSIWTEAATPNLRACGLGDPRQDKTHRVVAVTAVWIEKPVIYPRSKARPNDIVKLAVEAGTWGGIYSVFGIATHYVEPAQWKGQVPKNVHHARIWAALSEDEQEIVSKSVKALAPSKRHNVLDAVAMGLWVAKRA